MKKFLLIFVLLEIFLVGVFLVTSHSVLAAASATTNLPNPLDLSKIGGKNLQTAGDLIAYVTAGFAGIMAALAIAFIVFNGFKLMIAGNEEAIEKARNGLTWSVGGFIVALLSFTIIASAAKFLGYANNPAGQTSIINPIKTGDEATSRNFIGVLNYIMVNFLVIMGFASILMIVYYGYRYITAAGNEEATGKAKKGLQYAIAGFVVAILAYTIIVSIQRLLLNAPTT